MKRKQLSKQLTLRKDTLLSLTGVQAGYCSNSTLSAQVSLCVVNGTGIHPVPIPECATPVN